MDISDATLIAFSSVLVITSATAIVVINFRRLCNCFIKKPEIIENPVNPIQVWN